MDLSLELMDILTNLQNDPDRDVLEAVEETDHQLLQSRKKNKTNPSPDFLTNQQREQFQKDLIQREKEEIEERKKRVDDEEEKFDFATSFLETKKYRGKGGKYNYNRTRPLGSLSSGKSNISSGISGLKKIPLSKINDGEPGHENSRTPLKKKNTMNYKRQITYTGSSNELDFSKQRKNSVLIGGSKDDQIKRYHAMINSQGSTTANNGS